MKYKKLKRVFKRVLRRALKLIGRKIRRVLRKPKAKYLKLKAQVISTSQMEVKEALYLAFKFLHLQIKIRPRVRLISKFILILLAFLALSNKAVALFKAKEADIKINGQQVMVAEKRTNRNINEEVELKPTVVAKISPFEFNRPVEIGYISQGFAFYHRANDIATSLGVNIHPLGNGTVEFAGYLADGKGNVVVIDHGNDLKSLYAHMGRINVGVGNAVTKDATIGTVGLTGRTTGPHVHLEIIDNGTMVDPSGILPE